MNFGVLAKACTMWDYARELGIGRDQEHWDGCDKPPMPANPIFDRRVTPQHHAKDNWNTEDSKTNQRQQGWEEARVLFHPIIEADLFIEHPLGLEGAMHMEGIGDRGSPLLFGIEK